ncbi:glycosyltransferase, partial [bacterium]|nr:glycosyltransferase [bacterium]
MKRPGFSIIIPYYNNFPVLRDYLNSLECSIFKNFEVIIVNDSNIKFPIVSYNFLLKLINTHENLGYGRSLNKGAQIAEGEYLILSNSDILIDNTSLGKLYRAIEKNNEFKIFQPLLTNGKGEYDKYCKRYLPNKLTFAILSFKILYAFPFFRIFYKTKKKEEIECGKAAFTIVKREVFQKIGGMSPEYWMFWEDVDLFMKAKKRKYGTLFIPIPIVHLEGQTVKQLKLKANIGELRSRAVYFHKWFGIPPKLVFLTELKSAFFNLVFHFLSFHKNMVKYYN